MKYFFIIIFLTHLNLQAKTHTSIKNHLLFETQKIAEFEALEQDLLLITKLSKSCDRQWKEFGFPESCFALSLIYSKLDLSQSENLNISQLNSRCQKVSEKIFSLKALSKIAKLNALSSKCIYFLNQQSAKLAYIRNTDKGNY